MAWSAQDLPPDRPGNHRTGLGRRWKGAGGSLLGPLDIEDKMVVAKTRHPCNGTCSILPAVKADKSKTLGLPSSLVLGQVDSGDGAERPEEFLQVSLTSVLGQVSDTDGGIVVSSAVWLHGLPTAAGPVPEAGGAHTSLSCSGRPARAPALLAVSPSPQ